MSILETAAKANRAERTRWRVIPHSKRKWDVLQMNNEGVWEERTHFNTEGAALYFIEEVAMRAALRAMAECEPSKDIHEAFWNVVGPRDSWRVMLLAEEEEEEEEE